jgi:hypothetical protein
MLRFGGGHSFGRNFDRDRRRLLNQILELMGLVKPERAAGGSDQNDAGERDENAPGSSWPGFELGFWF